jgi:hypothetical protein
MKLHLFFKIIMGIRITLTGLKILLSVKVVQLFLRRNWIGLIKTHGVFFLNVIHGKCQIILSSNLKLS